MAEFRCKSFGDAIRLMERHNRQRERRIDRAIAKTANQGAQHVRRNVPVAFSELRDSIHTEDGHRIVADAPHAAPVEVGSRPHWPPLAPLVEWVKLRGMQALDSRGRLDTGSGGRDAEGRFRRRLTGTTTREHALRIGTQLRDMQVDGQNMLEDPVIIALGIQRAIAARGTRPHWYMRESVPPTMEILDRLIREAMPDPAGAPAAE